MLVSHTIAHYHQQVPLQVGIWIIDHVVKYIMEEELISLAQSWKLAYVNTVLSKSSQAREVDKEFDLNQVKGNVIVTKEVTIPTFQTRVVKDLMSHWTSQACSHIGGAILQMPKHFHSR